MAMEASTLLGSGDLLLCGLLSSEWGHTGVKGASLQRLLKAILPGKEKR
jgi:hypothetical protein